jgi:tetratricopeptide (TPR) repeat protein
VCFWTLALDPLGEHATTALSLAEKLGDRSLAAASMSWLGGGATAHGDVLEALQWTERASERVNGGFVPGLANRANALHWLGRFDEALASADQMIKLARAVGDVYGLLLALPARGLALASQGRYAEAIASIQEAEAVGQRHANERFGVRALCIEGGVHLDVFDLDGAEAIAERARARAKELTFPPPMVSASIDLLFVYIRRGDRARAEELIPSVREAVAKGAGWHGWLWALRLTTALAELALLRGDAEDVLHEVPALIDQNPKRARPRYRILGLQVRGLARAKLGDRDGSLADLRTSITEARALGDLATVLRAMRAMLTSQADAALEQEATALTARIAAALPTDAMRAGFLASRLARKG